MIFRNKTTGEHFTLLTKATLLQTSHLDAVIDEYTMATPSQYAVVCPVDRQETYVIELATLYAEFDRVDDTASTNGDLYEQLTPREREVAKYVMLGWPNKAIALKLNITDRTVKGHLTNIFSKTAFISRAELASFMTVISLVHRDRAGMSVN